jgi:hypothetical protein
LLARVSENSPTLSPKKAEILDSAWPPQVVDPLVPNQVLGFFELFRESKRGKFSVFKSLQKLFSARRLPPTFYPTTKAL